MNSLSLQQSLEVIVSNLLILQKRKLITIGLMNCLKSHGKDIVELEEKFNTV